MNNVWTISSTGIAWIDIQIDEEVELKYLAVKISNCAGGWRVVRQTKVNRILVESKSLKLSFVSLEDAMDCVDRDIDNFEATL